MKAMLTHSSRVRRATAGFSLSELVIAVGISALVFGGGLIAYVQATQQAEWSAYSLAAQSLANMRMEQARAAKWDTQASPTVDQLVTANFPVRVEVLDVPISGTNVVPATNFITITTGRPIRRSR
jgi:Tfp pilus assembly protein PilV